MEPEYHIAVVILVVFLINAGGFFLGGGLLHWLYFHRRRDDAARWKHQPKKFPTRAGILERLPLVMVNAVVINTVIGIGLWATLNGWTPTYFSLSDGPLWRAVATPILAGIWYHLALYYVHRSLHHPRVYRYVHYLHHKYKAPIWLDGLYEHPLEAAYGGLVIIAPLLLLPNWFGGWVIFLVVVGVHEVLDHSGIAINIPLLSKAKHHDIHHQRFNHYYGQLLGWLDAVHGTGYSEPSPDQRP